jgi:NCAIR mutase (PurE)-related protein
VAIDNGYGAAVLASRIARRSINIASEPLDA